MGHSRDSKTLVFLLRKQDATYQVRTKGPNQIVRILHFSVRMGKKDNGSGKTQELAISFSQTKRNLNNNILGSSNALYSMYSASRTENIDLT